MTGRLAAWLSLLCAGMAMAGELTPAPYLRSVTRDDGVATLEVAARELVPDRRRAPHIWLVGVVHLGEERYYQELQTLLDGQAVVLFEGIGATDGNFQLQEEDFSLQDAMAKALGLKFQLEAINYHRPNFRNSDLDYAGLARLFEGEPGTADVEEGAATPESGGGEFNLLVQIMEGRGLFGGLARLGVAAVGSSPRLQAATRLMLIEMLGNLPANLSDVAGMAPGMQRLMEGLIERRNEVVLRDVRREIRRRPRPASIAVFYGAGHMGHLETSICAALGYVPKADRWFTALSVDPKAAGLSRLELAMTRTMVRMQLKALQSAEEGSSASTEENEKPGKAEDNQPPAPVESPKP